MVEVDSMVEVVWRATKHRMYVTAELEAQGAFLYSCCRGHRFQDPTANHLRLTQLAAIHSSIGQHNPACPCGRRPRESRTSKVTLFKCKTWASASCSTTS